MCPPIKIVEKEVLMEVVEDVICDICRGRCGTEGDFEYSHLYAEWGYGSHKDGDVWNYVFCENCTDKIIDQIKILGFKLSATDRCNS